MFGKAFGAIATVQQKRFARGNFAQCTFELARFACKNERRKARELRFHGFKGALIRKSRHLLNRL